jgi:nucleotide-binding universal stress UspA family protein
MRLLVAIDTSASWKAIIDEVARRSWPCGSTVRVLTVLEPHHIWDSAANGKLTREAAESFVDHSADYLCCAGLDACSLVRQGDAKTVVLDEAEQSGADLLILGPHGHSGLTRFLVGSVARKLLRSAHCSVEIVRPKPISDYRVLLATDGSPCSLAAAGAIAQRPWPSTTEIEILTVVEPVVPSRHNPYPPYFDEECMEVLRADAMRSAQQAVGEAEKIVSGTGLKTLESILVPVGLPQRLILEEAERWDADLIMMGSHRRHGIPRLLIGSVSEAVALHAECSVEVVRSC